MGIIMSEQQPVPSFDTPQASQDRNRKPNFKFQGTKSDIKYHATKMVEYMNKWRDDNNDEHSCKIGYSHAFYLKFCVMKDGPVHAINLNEAKLLALTSVDKVVEAVEKARKGTLIPEVQ